MPIREMLRDGDRVEIWWGDEVMTGTLVNRPEWHGDTFKFRDDDGDLFEVMSFDVMRRAREKEDDKK